MIEILNLSFKFLSSEIKIHSLKLTANSLKPKAVFAEVVKLANTLRSGRSGRKSLRVQLPPSAVLVNSNSK